jgi:dTDP-4-dehydrorhamnose 3,5-epimerase
MKVTRTSLTDVLLLEPRVFGDARGFFLESFNARAFREASGLDVSFVQDNHSRSVRNTLRGLHYQLPPSPQGKLVRCVSGEVYDVAVDLRQTSPTFGHWVGEFLSAENYRQLWIPEGFAHGFLVVSETADFLYKTTGYYAPESEQAIRWDDPELAISWPLQGDQPLISEKDSRASIFRDAVFFP